eukprot:1571180-Karenia_brevis.AAC.1
MVRMQRLQPRHDSADWARHVYRELNTVADELAGHMRSLSQSTAHMAHTANFGCPWTEVSRRLDRE